MLTYVLMMMLPCWGAIIFRKRLNKPLYLLVALLFILFIGLRYQVGADWQGYELIHRFMEFEDFDEVLTRREPLAYALFWVSQNNGYEMYLTNLVAAAILVSGVYAFALRTLNPWLAVVSATPYLVIAFGMTGIRQAMGVGVILLVLSKWEKIGLLIRGIGVLVASLFHSSALVAGFLVIYGLRIKGWMKVVGGSFLGVIIYYFTTAVDRYAEAIEDYQDRYIEEPEAIFSAGSLFHIGLIFAPSLLAILVRHRIKPCVPFYDLLILGSIAGISLVPLNIVSTTMASRLSLYFYFVPMMVYPAITEAFGSKNIGVMKILIVGFNFAVLVTWLLFGNNAFAHFPYRNLLFENI